MPGKGGWASRLDIHETRCCIALEGEGVTWSWRIKNCVCWDFSCEGPPQAGDKPCTLEKHATWEWDPWHLWKWGQCSHRFLYWPWGRGGAERDVNRGQTGDPLPGSSCGLSCSCVNVHKCFTCSLSPAYVTYFMIRTEKHLCGPHHSSASWLPMPRGGGMQYGMPL